MYADDYVVGAVLYFLGIAWLAGKLLAWEETKGHPQRAAVSVLILLLAGGFFVGSLFWTRHRHRMHMAEKLESPKKEVIIAPSEQHETTDKVGTNVEHLTSPKPTSPRKASRSERNDFLQIAGSVGPADYVQPMAGINWNPKYSELRVTFSNATERDLTGLDFWVSPDLMIAGHGQAGNIPNVDFFLGNTREVPPITPQVEQEWQKRTENKQPAILALPMDSSSIRVRCATLPREAMLEVILALIKERALPGKVGFFALSGLPPKALATKVHIEGVYQDRREERKISQEITPPRGTLQ